MSLYFFGWGYVSRGGVKFSKIWEGGGGSDRFIIILGGLGKKGYPGACYGGGYQCRWLQFHTFFWGSPPNSVSNITGI